MSESSDNSAPNVKIMKDGPLVIKGIDTFINSKGEDISAKPVMSLCRCGHSVTRPLCDGTHSKIGFTGKKEDDRVPDRLDVYQGRNITIYDNRGVCSHRGYCTEELPSVFNTTGIEPWIDPDGATPEEIIEICRKCPSGALSFSLPGGERTQGVDRDPMIAIAPRRYGSDGPYDFMGGIEFSDPDNSRPECTEHYALCRCGASKNKPFCSGQHWNIKFIDDEN